MECKKSSGTLPAGVAGMSQGKGDSYGYPERRSRETLEMGSQDNTQCVKFIESRSSAYNRAHSKQSR